MKTTIYIPQYLVRLLAIVAILTGSTALIYAQILPDPIFHWELTNGVNSGTSSINPLTITNNTSGTAAFSTNGLNLTGNIGGQDTPQAQAGYALGSLGNVGALSQFTITFWINTPVAKSGYQSILTMGPEDGGMGGSNNVLFLRYNSSVGNNNNKLEVWPVGSSDVSGITQQQTNTTLITNNAWTFVAISYDGTSTRVDNSLVQSNATGTTNNRGTANLQVYQGSDVLTNNILREGYYWGLGSTNWLTNKGSLELGTNPSIFLGSKDDFSRSLSGYLKDVRVYDEVLSASQIGDIRAIPEPQSLALILMGVISSIAFYRGCRR